MLIEKPTFNTNDILAIKLMSGEEILARCVEVSVDSVTIMRPYLMVLTTDSRGSPGQGFVTMAPFMLGLDDETKIHLDQSKYMVAVKARKDAADQYRKSTSSLEIPKGTVVKP